MKKLTKLATYKDLDIQIIPPFSKTLINERDMDYKLLSDDDFRKKYRQLLFEPIILNINEVEHRIQLNYCYNPFCKWYSLPQKKYDGIKGKPSRYKIAGSKGNTDEPRMVCNTVEDVTVSGISLNNTNEVISNWSVAEEIQRLISINSVIAIEKDYIFHKEGCKNIDKTPFEQIELFYKRGKSSSNSTKYQCKECKKMTNVIPQKNESYNYHQSRNEVLIGFTKSILSRTPVKRICENLEIASSTYYNKLEWVYRKCLEFLERHETEPIKNISFEEVWLNTDMMVYNLNNIRRNGKGRVKKLNPTDKKLQTYLIASGDLKSGYVFRNDLAYDFNVTLDDIKEDTIMNHCDHSYSFLRKNERLKYPYCPQPPTQLDSQSYIDYAGDLSVFNARRDYVEGSHVKAQYTALAHYWLIKEMLNTKKWFFVSDDDSTIEASMFRVFSNAVKNKQAHYFTCQNDKLLTLQEAGAVFFQDKLSLENWGDDNGYKNKSFKYLANKKLQVDLSTHDFYNHKIIDGTDYIYRGSNPIRTPLAFKDEGYRKVNCLTDVTDLSTEQLSNLILSVNSRVINNYFQKIRRRISILERPFVTARGDGRSYIYANYNPKYAQYILTIFRTMYNFCWPTEFKGKISTPAMKLGLTDKVFNIKDIIYFK